MISCCARRLSNSDVHVNTQTQGAEKTDEAVETERMTEVPPDVVRSLNTPPLARHETDDSVEIVCDVIA